MTRIERTVVASGVIGQYNHEWVVMKLYDRKTYDERYNLFIGNECIGCYPSVVKALAVLVAWFEE